MPKSTADYIREELERDFDMKAEEIIDRLAKKGIRCQAQQIYQIRSVLRHSKSKTKTMVPVPRRKVAENAFPHGRCLLSLEECIVSALTLSDGLTDKELSDAVKKVGYGNIRIRKRGDEFFNLVQNKLHEMVKGEHGLVKIGSKYLLKSTFHALEQSRNEETHFQASEYQLLREAVIRLAKQRGFDNPEGLPDTLIRVHREFTQLEQRLETEYSSLFSSK